MKKPIVVILSISIVCIGAIGAYMFWKQKPAASSTQTQTQNQTAEELAVWEDQAGFSFKYPKELSFDKHDEDQENYAHIEFTSATHSGRLIIWAKDTTYPDVAIWVTKDKTLIDAVAVDTTLGGVPAKKLVITTPSKKLTTGAISDQILFTVEAEPIEGDTYWTTVLDTITSSFAFTSTNADTSAPSEASYDEEEVVE